MQPLAADALVAAWERGRDCPPLDRALVLYAMAVPDAAADALADRPLGERNRALLRLRQALFGDVLAACIDCPQCNERLEFGLSASTLLARQAPGVRTIEVDGIRFRLPTTRDLARIAQAVDSQAASRQLFGSIVEYGTLPDEARLAPLVERVAGALDEADPCIDLSLAVGCPACSHHWSVSLDVAGYLWDEIDVRARTLLDDVHVLARAYGWDEARILGLSDARRCAYLERVAG